MVPCFRLCRLSGFPTAPPPAPVGLSRSSSTVPGTRADPCAATAAGKARESSGRSLSPAPPLPSPPSRTSRSGRQGGRGKSWAGLQCGAGTSEPLSQRIDNLTSDAIAKLAHTLACIEPCFHAKLHKCILHDVGQCVVISRLHQRRPQPRVVALRVRQLRP